MKEGAGEASIPVLVVRRDDGGRSGPERDALVVEEPLEVRLRWPGAGSEPFVVTMRTPGDDEDLAAGLLFGEGVVDSGDAIVSIDRPEETHLAPELARNLVVVTLLSAPSSALPGRSGTMSSACGVCGKTSIGEVVRLAAAARERSAMGDGGPRVAASTVVGLPRTLRESQRLFAATGGLHAAGLFEADGRLVLSREDVGRHNAVDKVAGALLRARRPTPPVLLVSGRLGFEIVQKAALAGVRLIAAVGAPTSLAVDLAEETGMTLVGFLRGERFNVYTHPERVDFDA